MSYTQSDAAIETCNSHADVNPNDLDPDQLFDFAVKVIEDCKFVKYMFTEDGYLKGDGE